VLNHNLKAELPDYESENGIPIMPGPADDLMHIPIPSNIDIPEPPKMLIDSGSVPVKIPDESKIPRTPKTIYHEPKITLSKVPKPLKPKTFQKVPNTIPRPMRVKNVPFKPIGVSEPRVKKSSPSRPKPVKTYPENTASEGPARNVSPPPRQQAFIEDPPSLDD
jgi:hypothetical protein